MRPGYLTRTKHVLIRTEETISKTLLGFIVILVFVAALTRFVGRPINWSVDIAQAIYVWVIYLGANQALRSSRHIGVDLLYERLPAPLKLLIGLTHYLLIALFLSASVVNGVRISIVNAGRIIADIPISYSYVTMAVPVGSFLMILTCLGKMARLVDAYKAEKQQLQEAT